MANTSSIAANRPEIWAKETFRAAMDKLFFKQKNLMGTGENVIVKEKSELNKSKGDTIDLSLVGKLSGNGITGDNELEGNEEAQDSYNEQIVIDQIRNAIRLTGKLDEQTNGYDMRVEAKAALSTWIAEFLERQIFMKLAGVNNLLLTDVYGTVVGARSCWSNTPDEYPDADTTANGGGVRYSCADVTGGATSLASTDIMTPYLIDRMKAKMAQANPIIQPLMIGGKECYVMFVHPRQAFDLRRNAEFQQAMREAAIRGPENPIFTGALGIWNDVVLHEHRYCPYLDLDVAGNNYGDDDGGTDYAAVDAYRAIICGQNAVGLAMAGGSVNWEEETFDYGNKTGFAVGFIGGVQKLMFATGTSGASVENGVMVLDTAATAV